MVVKFEKKTFHLHAKHKFHQFRHWLCPTDPEKRAAARLVLQEIGLSEQGLWEGDL